MYFGTTVVNNCVFLENVAQAPNTRARGGAIHVFNGNLSVLDCTFTKDEALQDDPSAFDGSGGGGAISAFAYGLDVNLLVAGSVLELNEAYNEGGAAFLE